MTFEVGNQVAKGSTNNGRPDKFDLDDLAKKLDEWSKHPASIQLLDFCVEHDFSAKRLSEWGKRHAVFSEALDRAKTRIGAKRERFVNYQKLDVRVFNRYQGMYDSLLNEHEREEKEFEYGLKKSLDAKPDNISKIEVIDYAKAG